jgi:SagB-type dehydrogenase family enzyme
MKRLVASLIISLLVGSAGAQELKTIQLNEHSKVRGSNIMETLQNRQSTRAYDTTDISLQDLSDLLWAANGINRPEKDKIGKKTAPSAQNSQDVDIFVCTSDGTFFYEAYTNSLKQVITQDIRPLMEGRRPAGTPVLLLLVSDMSKYRGYRADSAQYNKNMYDMGALDAGIVSQNISLFCAGIGLGTIPRAGMDKKGIHKALNLTASQVIWLNHPVGFPKK